MSWCGIRHQDLVLNDIADADRRDHTVEDERYAADGSRGHCSDERGKFRAAGAPSRAVPELGVWPFVKFEWLRKPRTLVDNDMSSNSKLLWSVG